MKTGELLSKLEGLRRQAEFAENRLDRILAENSELQSKNKKLEATLRTQKTELDALKETLKSLQLQRALTGNEQTRHQAKLKINQFIREIDLCLAQLRE
jgi:predicted nuclease with TOPRIM domain